MVHCTFQYSISFIQLDFMNCFSFKLLVSLLIVYHYQQICYLCSVTKYLL